MKKVLFLILCLSWQQHFSQSDDGLVVCPFDENKKINYSGLIDVPGQSKSEIYKKLKDHLQLEFADKNYPQLVNDTNKIVGKAVFKAPFNSRNADVIYKYTILIKDNKFKYEFTDMILVLATSEKIMNGYWIETKNPDIVKYPIEEKYTKSYRKRRKDKSHLINPLNGFFETIEENTGVIIEGYKSAVNKKDW